MGSTTAEAITTQKKMETTKGNGKMERRMVLVSVMTVRIIVTKGASKRIKNMEEEKKHTQTVKNTLGIFIMTRSKDMECIILQMVTYTREIGRIITVMGRGNKSSKMGHNLLEPG